MRKWLMLAVLIALFCGVQIASADFGSDWNADYYNSTDLSGAVAYTEMLPNGINMNWGNSSPNNFASNGDNFSARFTSVQTFDAGDYLFLDASDDGIRVFIDGDLVLDQFIGRVLSTDHFVHTMTAGEHSLTVEYVEFIDQAAIQFQWFKVGEGDLPPGIWDGRVNGDDLASPAAVFCQSYGTEIYAIDAEGHGTLALTVTPEQIAAVADDPEAKLIASVDEPGGALELWHTPDGQLLLRSHEPTTGKVHDFVWGGCSA